MRYFFHKEDAEVVRIEKDAPRTLYTCIQPNTAETKRLAMGLEEIDPHSEIPLHSHDEAEEIIFIFGGQGKGFVGNQVAELKPGTVIFIPPKIEHRFVNTGEEPLWLTWTFSPPGFEKRIRKVADGSAGMGILSNPDS
ncbi:MAG: cupin domain-containing protein [Candidatus Poribacteria bacterium]|nr:cupin domain-containing protein [Candidatus Poribacteria bacterium]